MWASKSSFFSGVFWLSLYNLHISYRDETSETIVQNLHCLILYLYINLACLFVCLFVCLYPINVKTAEPIGPKFFVGHLGTVYEWSKFQIFVSIKIRSSLNFWKFWKSTTFFVKIRQLFFVLFYDLHKENMFTINLQDGREAPYKASYI